LVEKGIENLHVNMVLEKKIKKKPPLHLKMV
jgi:hypothetical protein